MKTNAVISNENTVTSTLPIGSPTHTQVQELRELWKEAFGDNDAFLDIFEKTAFDIERCRCITLDNKVASALYWFDCEYQGKQIAYIYAVATAVRHQKQGLCHTLMNDTHSHLKMKGYAGAILVPGSPMLFDFYEKIGYKTCSYVKEFSCESATACTTKSVAGQHNNALTPPQAYSISKEEYAKLRRSYLPELGVIQEQENLDFLEAQADFYVGEDFLLVYQKQGDYLHGIELLGNTSMAPAILDAFQCKKGRFRTPGHEKPFAMFYSFTEHMPLPTYFGLAFD